MVGFFTGWCGPLPGKDKPVVDGAKGNDRRVSGGVGSRIWKLG